MATALKGLVPEREAMIDYAITIQAQADQAMIDLLDRPVDPKLFFRGEVPSILARRRLTK
ncbi:MAG TPA: hypothetical protein PK156_17330 [Polyangium sp.]|nr:hypothetical protein [Polyangium sp.]